MCFTPIELSKETWTQKLRDNYKMQQVPCGRCLECKKMRVNAWHARLMQELKTADSASFVTFTYEDSFIPTSSNGLMTLDYSDLQKYWKLLRKHKDRHETQKLKYFAAGEYGSQTNRPHYHAIIFNHGSIHKLEKYWHHGAIHRGDVNEATIYYTLKYALKKAGPEFWKKPDPDDDRKPEKACMSKGLGLDFLTPEMINYYKNNLDAGITHNGNELPLPRYYRDRILTNSEKIARVRLLEPHMAQRYDKTSSPKFPEQVRYLHAQNEKKNKKTD